eukprot:gene19144-21063_t
MTARDWAWGPTAYWKVYPSGKRSATSLIDNSFVKYISNTVANYQENLVKAYKNAVIKSRKLIRPRSYGIHSHGRFGSALNSVFVNNNRKRNQHLRRTFMNEHADIVLSTEEINKILRAQEHTAIMNDALVTRIDFNELSSNKPMEDQSFAYKSNYNDNLIIGLLDGHGGSACAEKIRRYLPLYISAALIDESFSPMLAQGFHSGLLAESFLKKPRGTDRVLDEKLLSFAKEILSKQSTRPSSGPLAAYVQQVLGPSFVGMDLEVDNELDVGDLLKEAFLRLDVDAINDVIEKSKSGMLKLGDLSMTASGCCALVASINGADLHVANAGDCRAVMGSYHDGEWAAIQLTHDHTAMANPDEVQRILAEHPGESQCIQYGRLLGRLAPLRAFGDMRFKLDAEQQRTLIGPLDRKFKTFSGLKSPPYLTAEPEVFQYRMEKSDKFIVLATDGLWDMLSNQEVVELVGAFMEGRGPDAMKKRAINASIANLDDVLSSSNDLSDVDNDNVSTFLIRCALGGYDFWSLSAMLTLPHPDVRMYRDDMSVIVIFFDNEN